ncbi:hypothetical protein [Pantoea sp. SM3]|uniref:hypothetical protein n=1 Tax=Pantoea sp. SM3 TaxID=1628192 RepID=UPI0005F7CEF8|nr:hypothetical protein [Pantoea sp. SM3]KJV28209.1 hypothetical protein VI01_17865 [Pantoea sp. SM3]
MISLGFVSKKMLANWNGAPLHLPDFQFHEKHRAVIKTNCPEKIMPLIKAFDLEQDSVIRALMSIRQLPQKLQGKAPKTHDDEFGLQTFTLLHASDLELCYGLRGEFWRADFGLEKISNAEKYQQPARPGAAKLLLRYQVNLINDSQSELITETFIHCPDKASHCKMAAYWLAIRAGSGLIRRRMLSSVKHELENTLIKGKRDDF